MDKNLRKHCICAVFTALCAICSQIQIPLPMVPINLALFAVNLAGALLGAKPGAVSVAAYVLLGALGAPVFAGFAGGMQAIAGQTGGYIFGIYPCCVPRRLAACALGYWLAAALRRHGAGHGRLLCVWNGLVYGGYAHGALGKPCLLRFSVSCRGCGQNRLGNGAYKAARSAASGHWMGNSLKEVQFNMEEKKAYSFFCNAECEFFPCHKTNDLENFNCLFCYCPLYALGENCGGNFTYTENGVKDCSNCMIPHKRGTGYDYIIKHFSAVMELAKKK